MTKELKPHTMVYKINGELYKEKVAAIYKTFHFMTPHELYTKVIGTKFHNSTQIVKIKETSRLITISSTFLGYISSTVVGGQEGVYMYNPLLKGYNVVWESKGFNNYSNFEDENTIIPLKDIEVLNPFDMCIEVKSWGIK